MERMISETPLQQKSIPPTWQFESPFSDLTFTSAGPVVDLEYETLTQNFEHTPGLQTCPEG